ncbi:hypothetical protein DPMN_038996 [Dreissena polymorpha]|uniref:Uncharacterized protein n=1 Tax=Dreissena polymorpha TaxID=45954 RepID=A0A9D4ME83_DREPO|nr:hypothetical protein DPMN_038996 [Dreissena polymorpha]
MLSPLGGHVFQPNGTIFKLIQDIIGTNLLTKFHEDRTINVAFRVKIPRPPPPWWPYIIWTNLLIKLHDDQEINVAFRVLTMFYNSHIRINLLTKFHEDRPINVASRVFTMKNAPPLGSHVFQANLTIFELIQDIIKTNRLTKHEDWTINVASRVLTRQMLTPYDAQRTTHDGQKAITKAHHEHIVPGLAPIDRPRF